MAWHRIGDKPLSEPMLTWFTDTYTCGIMKYNFFIALVTYWGWVMHLCVSKLPIIDSDNGLWLVWGQVSSEPMLTDCQLNPQEQTWVKFESKCNNFHSRKFNLKMDCCKMVAICFSLNELNVGKMMDAEWTQCNEGLESLVWKVCCLQLLNIFLIPCNLEYKIKVTQGSFCICAQPMRDGIAL